MQLYIFNDIYKGFHGWFMLQWYPLLILYFSNGYSLLKNHQGNHYYVMDTIVIIVMDAFKKLVIDAFFYLGIRDISN